MTTVDALDCPRFRGRSSMVEPQPSKLIMPVRSRSAAPRVVPVQRPDRTVHRGRQSVSKPSSCNNRALRDVASSASDAADVGKKDPIQPSTARPLRARNRHGNTPRRGIFDRNGRWRQQPLGRIRTWRGATTLSRAIRHLDHTIRSLDRADGEVAFRQCRVLPCAGTVCGRSVLWGVTPFRGIERPTARLQAWCPTANSPTTLPCPALQPIW